MIDAIAKKVHTRHNVRMSAAELIDALGIPADSEIDVEVIGGKVTTLTLAWTEGGKPAAKKRGAKDETPAARTETPTPPAQKTDQKTENPAPPAGDDGSP